MNKKVFSLICAISCSVLWGTAFVAQDMGMDYIGPYTFSAARLYLGCRAWLPFFFIFELKKIPPKQGHLITFLSTPDSIHGVDKIVSKNKKRYFFYGSYTSLEKVDWKMR